ncbi:CdaR family protein [Shouchella lonarensis]|uniref:YbbR domain-containing protein n=1 Tax=Shouchella lonarensis TaxID=1464122 RepID=A0A1G6PA26_9BACI|nr:CdaR family protein [Shouchella lonarensis]SDC76983.1 YbbR domain-containing protein [Shouchella lonarensis]
MDKLFNSIWFVRILAFFIALMLFAMVNQDYLGKPSLVPEASQSSYTLENVPLKVLYDEARYELVNQQETVSVELQGSQVSITLFQLTNGRSTEVFVDATEVMTEGEQTLVVQTRNFPSDLSVTVQPQVATVTLKEKQVSSVPVHAELKNVETLDDEYTVGSPIVTPVNVEVIGAVDILQQISVAKVFVDVTGAMESIEDEFQVYLYDEDGNELDLNVEPKFVSVSVPITSPTKLVPVKLTTENDFPEGMGIDEIEIEPNEVTIYGSNDILEEIEFVESEPIDLAGMSNEEKFSAKVRMPKGIERVEPKEVTASFQLAEEQSKTFVSRPIKVTGKNDDQQVVFMEGSEETVDVTVFGTASRLKQISAEDIHVTVDVSQLDHGEHTLPLKVTGPFYVQFETEKEVRVYVQS